MTRGVSIAVIIAMSLMSSFHERNAAATGYFYEQPTRPYNPPALSTHRSPGQYDHFAAGSKVVTSPRPRITVPPIPSLPPLTSLTTPKTKNTNRQPGSTADARLKPAAPVHPRPTVQAPQTQQQRSQFTRKTQPQSQSATKPSQSATKPSQFQQQPRPLFSQAPSNSQNFYQRQQSLRAVPATAAKAGPPTTNRSALKTAPTSTSNPSSKPVTKPTPRPTTNPTQKLPSVPSNTRFPVKGVTASQKQTATANQRPLVLPAPPLPKLPPTSALTPRTVAQVTTTRPIAPPATSGRWSFQKPDDVTNSRPIQASSPSGFLQSPDIYVINGRQLKQYKVYEQIENDIEQDLSSFIPANFFLHSYHARIGATHPLGEELQVHSRFGNQRTQQLLQPPGLQSPSSIALGSGGLGFVKLPNGNVYLGSGSLGYISGLQRTLDVVQARTRTGAPEPDATHFGHGSLSDPLYYSSD